MPAFADADDVRVYYATDRAPVKSGDQLKTFGTERATMSYGYADYDVPDDLSMLQEKVDAHRKREVKNESGIRAKFNLKRLQVSSSKLHRQVGKTWGSADHGNLQSMGDDETAFAQKVIAEGKPIVIYIHGFSVKFENALRNAARLAHSCKTAGRDVNVVLFSWPSLGSNLDYTEDLCNAEWATEDYITVVHAFRSAAVKPKSMSLLAHSMGNELMCRSLAYQPRGTWAADEKPMILDNVIMCSPDVDRLFAERIKPRIEAATQKVTLFVSNADWPLCLSRLINGQPRLGRAHNPPGFLQAIAPLLPESWLQLYPEFSKRTKQIKCIPVIPDVLSFIPHPRKERGETESMAAPKNDPKFEIIDFTTLDAATRQGHNVQWDMVAALLVGKKMETALNPPYRLTYALEVADEKGSLPYWVRRVTPFPPLIAHDGPITPVLKSGSTYQIATEPNCHCSVSDNRFSLQRVDDDHWALSARNATAGQWRMGIRCTRKRVPDWSDAIVTVE